MPAAAIIPAALQVGAGLLQSAFGGGRARRAERQLDKMIDSYTPSGSIMDYYNKALQRYNVNPYTSQLYNYQQNQIKSGTSQALQNLGDRRSTLAGLPTIIQNQNDALLKAAATAEGQQAQALGQLGQATALKDREDKYKFELKANQLSQKAGGGAIQSNAGMSNLFEGLGNISNYYLAKEMLGGNKK